MKQGEIILIKFTFSDHSDFKMRPALVISNKNLNNSDDIIILGISSQKGSTKSFVSLRNEDLTKGEIMKQSFVKCGSVLTIEKSLIVKTVAVITDKKLEEVLCKFSCFISFEK